MFNPNDLILGFLAGTLTMGLIWATNPSEYPPDKEVGYYQTVQKNSKGETFFIKVWTSLGNLDTYEKHDEYDNTY